ncbi:hypothetical protein VZC37_15725 [Gordonia sp. LSe1-13]|uniref:Chemotaxis protein n=1 Tax=Gordonia sesuvii TaxID=3116777 RepID=A0ABU7MFB4_9ACTN|nr:hypothetical protein [Gordonia sp. LSe1-13]
MVLPLIPVVAIAVGAAAGGSGLALGGKGAYDIKKANAELGAARKRYEARRADSEMLVESVNDRIVRYGSQQEGAIREVVLRMHDFLIRNEKKVRENEKLLVDGIEANVNLVAGSASLDLSISEWVRGVIGSVGAGAGAGAATSAAATTFGVASTGAAISGLSGAAAESAALAWLGGGAVAAGGGGMALGALALNFVTIGPGLLVAGFVVKGQGKKAATQARAYQAEIEVEIANLDAADAQMGAVQARTDELSDLLFEMADKAIAALDELEAEPFDPGAHAPLFQRTMVLVKGVIDLATTPVIDENGELTDDGHRLTVKYRKVSSAPSTTDSKDSKSPVLEADEELARD